MTRTKSDKTGHESVLLAEAVEALSLSPDDCVVDATVGGAGHFSAIERALGKDGILVGIDADRDALIRAKAALPAGRTDGPTVHLVEGNFRDLPAVLDRVGLATIDKILFDLGWSGYQLTGNRGFTFQAEEPLLMTYGAHQPGKAAADLVNTATEEELADILHTYGEERFARGIARAIVERRRAERILSTTALVEAVKAGTPAWYHTRRIHPATKTFQAIRIAVNDEFNALRDALAASFSRVEVGGRIAVISFHSSEDRIVKNAFREAMEGGRGTVRTKKPITPSDAELAKNPRARSAKLRVFEVTARPAAVSAPLTVNLPHYA